jgi:hypothetical protein
MTPLATSQSVQAKHMHSAASGPAMQSVLEACHCMLPLQQTLAGQNTTPYPVSSQRANTPASQPASNACPATSWPPRMLVQSHRLVAMAPSKTHHPRSSDHAPQEPCDQQQCRISQMQVTMVSPPRHACHACISPQQSKGTAIKGASSTRQAHNQAATSNYQQQPTRAQISSHR